jgi:hypothetical protein
VPFQCPTEFGACLAVWVGVRACMLVQFCAIVRACVSASSIESASAFLCVDLCVGLCVSEGICLHVHV